jgi:hypothetical protein
MDDDGNPVDLHLLPRNHVNTPKDGYVIPPRAEINMPIL